MEKLEEAKLLLEAKLTRLETAKHEKEKRIARTRFIIETIIPFYEKHLAEHPELQEDIEWMLKRIAIK